MAAEAEALQTNAYHFKLKIPKLPLTPSHSPSSRFWNWFCGTFTGIFISEGIVVDDIGFTDDMEVDVNAAVFGE